MASYIRTDTPPLLTPPPGTPTTSILPSTLQPAGDENAYLRQVREVLTAHSPQVLLTTGYGVCTHVQKGWDCRFIHEEVGHALWPPDEPRQTGPLIPDYANYRDDQLVMFAMRHLCRMSDEQMKDYISARNSGE